MQVEKNQFGFYTVINKPSLEELENYYAKKYYQDAVGYYEQHYSDEEITYFKNKIAQKFYIIEKAMDKTSQPSLLDIGCGEGWALQFFKDKGWEIYGLDYNSYACEKFNPECKENLIAGDIYGNLNLYINENKRFDVIWLDNVLEHVLDPEKLVSDIKKVIHPQGILVIEVPNDFSIIQNYAFERGHIGKEFWIAIPDHISYFNKTGLSNLMSACDWESICIMADYPIDWNLLNPDSNYANDRTKGKNCHKERIEFENLVHNIDTEKLITLYKSLADLGLGRQIIGFFKLH